MNPTHGLIVGLFVAFGIGVYVGQTRVPTAYPVNFPPELAASQIRSSDDAAKACWQLLAGDIGTVRKDLAALKTCASQDAGTAH